MKKFDNVEDLWQYMSRCPLCQSPNRSVEVSVGPDEEYSLIKFDKDGYNFVITSSLRSRVFKCRYDVVYHIDCLNNTYEFKAYYPDSEEKVDLPVLVKGNSAFNIFFFYLQSSCKDCSNTGVYSSDIELINGIVSNIMLEREDIYLLSEERKYRICYLHDEEKVKIAKCWYEKDTLQYSKKRFIQSLPFDLDFSDINKVLNKIGTLLTFS